MQSGRVLTRPEWRTAYDYFTSAMLSLGTCAVGAGMLIGAMIFIEKRLIKVSAGPLRRGQMRALKVDATMSDSLLQTRLFLKDLANDSSQPEKVCDCAGRLYRALLGRESGSSIR